MEIGQTTAPSGLWSLTDCSGEEMLGICEFEQSLQIHIVFLMATTTDQVALFDFQNCIEIDTDF